MDLVKKHISSKDVKQKDTHFNLNLKIHQDEILNILWRSSFIISSQAAWCKKVHLSVFHYKKNKYLRNNLGYNASLLLSSSCIKI